MRSRAWFAIFAMGLLGIVILGFLTKVALDSNAELKSLVQFKASFLEAFRASGVREISLRRGETPGSYEVRLVLSRRSAAAEAAPAAAGTQSFGPRVDAPTGISGSVTPFEEKVLRFFVERFPDKSARTIDLRFACASTLGCSAARAERHVKVHLPQYRYWLREVERAERLAQALEETGFRLLSVRRDGGTQTAEIEPADSGSRSRRELAQLAEPVLRRHFSAGGYRRLVVRVRQETPPGVEEVSFDPAGREVPP